MYCTLLFLACFLPGINTRLVHGTYLSTRYREGTWYFMHCNSIAPVNPGNRYLVRGTSNGGTAHSHTVHALYVHHDS